MCYLVLLQPFCDYEEFAGREGGRKEGGTIKKKGRERKKIMSLRVNMAWVPDDIIKTAKAMPAIVHSTFL